MAWEVKSQSWGLWQAGHGCGAPAVSYCSLVPSRRESGSEAKRKGGRSSPPRCSLHPEASGYFALDFLFFACLQPCLNFSTVSSLCSHSGTEEAGRTLQAAPGRSSRKAVRQGSRLQGEPYPPCRHSTVKKSERKGSERGEKGGGPEGRTAVATALEHVGAGPEATSPPHPALMLPLGPRSLLDWGRKLRETRGLAGSIWLDRPQRWSGRRPSFCPLSCDFSS